LILEDVDRDVDQLRIGAQEEAARITFTGAYKDWTRLNSDVDCWIDPDKRIHMLTARQRYQDAKLAYVNLLRGGSTKT